ncbi:MAG TPA: glycosyltransferase family 2 protein [Anaerolineae bacterium]|nr:glycosyltransferase family 2 protein [Anaerolineae bacterium]
MSDLGIVIVSYNVCALLRDCLKSAQANEGVRFSICVVDNGSPDDSAGMVEREFPQIHLIRNSNSGYAAGNNLGLRYFGFSEKSDPTSNFKFQTSNYQSPISNLQSPIPTPQDPTGKPPRYALLLNPDTIVPPDAFVRVVAYMDAHPDVGVLGVKLVRADGSLDLACRRSFPTPEVSFYRLAGLSKLFPRSPRFGRYNMTFLDPDRQAEVDSVVGAFMLVRSEAIAQAGLLDETFWMYGEDLDWAYRIKQRGWKVLYYPEVTVLHLKRSSSASSARARYEFQRAMWVFYCKHYRAVTPRWLDALVRLGLGLRGGRRLLAEMTRDGGRQ